MRDVTAVILGGGRGSRLQPLTEKRAKPAVGVGGKYRLIDIPISNCINSQIRKIFVVTQFLSVSLHRHIMRTYSFDIFSDGFIDILAAEQSLQRQDWFQGTADAVRGTLQHITYFRSDATLILSGDHLYRMDYRELVNFHLEKNADITLAVCPVDRDMASQMGLLQVDDDGEVKEFIEKPQDDAVVEQFRAPRSMLQPGEESNDRYLASMGVYCFKPDVLVDILTGSRQVDFGKEVIPAAIPTHRVMAYPFHDYWRDIGTIGAYFDANIAMAQPDPPFRLYKPDWPTYTRSRSLPPCRVVHSDIVDSLLAEGSDISGAHIEDSVIGVRSVLSPGAYLKEVVMAGADYFEGDHRSKDMSRSHEGLPKLGIGRDCRIEHAIIDKNARIGDNVIIRRQATGLELVQKNYWIRDGIVVVPKSAVIPSGTVI